MKNKMNRASVPGRVIELLWGDDEFCRDVFGHKKVSTSGKFPKSDQWCDERGFNMAFALAGYSPSDVTVRTDGRMLYVDGVGSNSEGKVDEKVLLESEDDYPAKTPTPSVQQGVILRGIARRNFRTKFFINPAFNLMGATATMKNGLLEIFIPKNKELSSLSIEIEEV